MNNLKFEYVNWRGENHTYVIVPERELSALPLPSTPGPSFIHLHGAVLTRDNENRYGVRRSFILTNMRNIEEVAPR